MNPFEEKRVEFEEIDEKLLQLLMKRIQLSKEVGQIKKDQNHPIEDRQREERIIEKVKSLPLSYLEQECLEELYLSLMDYSKKFQRSVQVLNFPFKRIGIIGLGLIGGSIAKAIKSKSHDIILAGLKRDHPDDKLAIKLGLVQEIHENLESLLEDIELLILATPLSHIKIIAKDIVQFSKKRVKNLFIIDISSVKEEITQVFEEITAADLEFISTHPMAGTEKSSLQHSKASLFLGAKWGIIPHRKNTEEGIEKIRQVISFLGADPLILDAKSHDKFVAYVSHLPYKLACLFLSFVQKEESEALKFAGPGFASFTRIAHGNPSLYKEILQENNSFVREAFEKWESFMQKK